MLLQQAFHGRAAILRALHNCRTISAFVFFFFFCSEMVEAFMVSLLIGP